MRKWRSHKIVEAELIMDIGTGHVIIPAHDGTDGRVAVEVSSNFFARGTPTIGDYLVRYEDGYLSWSPKKVFEVGYSLV